MVFWRKKEYTQEEMTEIIKDFTVNLRVVLRNHLPREMRRSMQKDEKKQLKMLQGENTGHFEEIKKKGLSSWLSESLEEAYKELSSFVAEPGQLQEDLQSYLRGFKKRWKIK